MIEACANLARRTVLGVGPSDAPEMKMENGEEPDVKPYLEGQADANMQEKGKRLMQDWLVKQEEEVEADKTGGSVEKKPRGRTLVIMGCVDGLLDSAGADTFIAHTLSEKNELSRVSFSLYSKQ